MYILLDYAILKILIRKGKTENLIKQSRSATPTNKLLIITF